PNRSPSRYPIGGEHRVRIGVAFEDRSISSLSALGFRNRRRNEGITVMSGVDSAPPPSAAIADAIVRVTGLTKRYGRTVALDGIDVAIRRNELFALLGPNGAGKTTLIHILCTILRPDAGTVTLAGFDVARAPRQARRHLGVVFQEPS